jgi:dienelactone hydrolase
MSALSISAILFFLGLVTTMQASTLAKVTMTQGAATHDPTHPRRTGPWNVDSFMRAPVAYPAQGYSAAGAQAVFLEGPPYRGKATRFFAWYGVPEPSGGKKVPGIVLVHGGGGTANVAWVKQWNARGYAAIALDTSATMPPVGEGPPIANPYGGPKGSDHCFTQLDEPLEDQWAYHGVADIMLAHSFLRSLPNVDVERTGITGISWGGYLTCLAIGIDHRFKFAVPVYGCGYLAEDSAWIRRFADMGEARAKRWKQNWDPALYLPNARLPILWINGDMDAAFSLKITRLSALAAPAARRYLSIQPKMPHGHDPGQGAAEIPVFADQVLNGGRPLAQVREQGCRGSYAWARFVDVGKVSLARCGFTRDSGPWMERKWNVVSATWHDGPGEASFTLPDDATAFYFVLTDDRGLMASSLPMERE